MILVTQEQVDSYLGTDVTGHQMDAFSTRDDEMLVCQQWLRNSSVKRYIYNKLYGKLFADSPRQRILDIGGGLTCFARELARHHEYLLVDLLAHENIVAAHRFVQNAGYNFIITKDWLDLQPSRYDVVIANDLFPNVDQRLELFLEQFLPQADRIKISLTWHDSPRYYKTKRVDADEILFMLAWDNIQLQRVLRKFLSRIKNPDLVLFEKKTDSVFANGRHVCLIEFMGD